MDMVCSACGAKGSGKFCSACGLALGGGPCHSCGAVVAAGAKFCTACGVPRSGPVPTQKGGPPLVPMIIAGVAVIALVVMLVQRNEPAPAQGPVAPFAAGATGTPPDLSTMTPREQFDRLYNRVMTAAEQGDTATVVGFSPMALQAYRNLDVADSDARYHAAMLRLHTGDVAGARALADSILVIQPGHLFGYVLQGAMARFGGQEAQLTEIYRNFLGAYEAEMASGKPEYRDHETMLTEFEKTARAR